MSNLPPNVRTVFETPHVRAFLTDNLTGRLVVTFDYMDRNRTWFAEPSFSGVYADKGWSQLRIQTAYNDWFLNRDLPHLKAALGAYMDQFETRRALGFSMGGFAALLLGDVLRLDRSILLAPQWSPIPDMVPGDVRYAEFEPNMDARFALQPDPQRVAHGDTFVLFDPRKREDQWQARAIQTHIPKTSIIALPWGGHPPMDHITAAKQFRTLQNMVLKPSLQAAEIRALHRGARTKSKAYWSGLAKAAGPQRALNKTAQRQLEAL